MLPRISHDTAVALEFIVRKVYNCNRFGAGGVADADTLEGRPMHGAYAALLPLYLQTASVPEVDEFLDHYACIYEYENDTPPTRDEDEKFIEDLNALVKKYYRE